MASINDVAKLAQVSKSTVSIVLNNSGYVSEETRKKVEDAIKKLNYTPSRLAQGLSKNRSGLIAVVVPDVGHPYFSTLIRSIEQALAKHEYMTIICSAKENEKTEQWYVEMLNRKIVDGIITAGHTVDLSSYKNSTRPIVSIDRYIDNKIPNVQADHKQAAQMAAELLVEAGCKKVAQFTGTPDIDVTSHNFNEHLEKVLLKNQIEVFNFYIGHNVFHASEYMHSAEKFFEKDIDVDAIVGTDSSILSCIQQAEKRGLKVPEDLKMIAYDGTYITRLHTPVVTAVVQPIKEIGECAARLMVDQINKKKLKEMQYIIPVELQRGYTC